MAHRNGVPAALGAPGVIQESLALAVKEEATVKERHRAIQAIPEGQELLVQLG
jgi:hypothetical protein